MELSLNNSRRLEKEADIMSMYLQKRAGYDITQWANTISILEQDDEDLFGDHPRTAERVKYIQKTVSKVEKDFEEKYDMETKVLEDCVPEPMNGILDSIIQWYRLTFCSIVCSVTNLHINELHYQ